MTHEEIKARLDEIQERAILGLHGASFTLEDSNNFLWTITQLRESLAREEELKVKSSWNRIKPLCEEIEKLRADLQMAITALEVYAMTNETFPEYGDVARAALSKLKSRSKTERQ